MHLFLQPVENQNNKNQNNSINNNYTNNSRNKSNGTDESLAPVHISNDDSPPNTDSTVVVQVQKCKTDFVNIEDGNLLMIYLYFKNIIKESITVHFSERNIKLQFSCK